MLPREALRKLGVPKKIVSHSEDVARIANAIAKRLADGGVDVDVGLVRAGALLHDVGRARTHDLRHGFVGAEMLRGLGFNEMVARIAETHVAGGLTASEAERLGLPARDYLPQTIEEKVVWYADKLSDETKIERILRRCGKRSAMGKRFAVLVREMEALCGKV